MKHRTIRNAISHLLNKALPQRCQIRNLKEIVAQYIKMYPSIKLFLQEVAAQVTIREEDILILTEHQRVLFQLLKLFVVKRVFEIPPLREHLQQRCDWNSFSNTIRRTCARIRLVVQSNYTRACSPLHGMENAILYMTRVQPRNILQPCMMTLLRQLGFGCTNSMLCDTPPLQDARVMLSTRVFENYGMSTQSAFNVRGALSEYLRDANKNLLNTKLSAIPKYDHGILMCIIRSITQRRFMSVESATWNTDITLCICRVCHEVKNTMCNFTSLRDVIYDVNKCIVCCVKKRSKLCRDTELLHIPMNKRCITVNSNTYSICEKCGSLYSRVCARCV